MFLHEMKMTNLKSASSFLISCQNKLTHMDKHIECLVTLF